MGKYWNLEYMQKLLEKPLNESLGISESSSKEIQSRVSTGFHEKNTLNES